MNGKGKTVLFATNQLFVLNKVDRIIMMRDGKIGEIGTYDELMALKGPFAELLDEFNSDKSKIRRESMDRSMSMDETERITTLARSRSLSFDSFDGSVDDKEADQADRTEEGKLIEKEGLEHGSVDKRVFELYFVHAVGKTYTPILCLVLLSVVTQAVQNMHEMMVGWWSTASEGDNDGSDFELYFILWGALGLGGLGLALARAYAWAFQAISASLNLVRRQQRGEEEKTRREEEKKRRKEKKRKGKGGGV